MEQIAYILNLTALLAAIIVVVWQSISNVDYARGQTEDCEKQVEIWRTKYEAERLRCEKLEMILSGSIAGINIRDSDITVQNDMVGGNTTHLTKT